MIRAHLRLEKLSINEFARRSGLPRRTLQLLLSKDVGYPTVQTIRRLVDATGVPADVWI